MTMTRRRSRCQQAFGDGWVVRQATLEDDGDLRVLELESPSEIGIQRLDGGRRLRLTLRTLTWGEIISRSVAAEILDLSLPDSWGVAFKDAYHELLELAVAAADPQSPIRRVLDWLVVNGRGATKEDVLWVLNARALGAGPRLVELARLEGGRPLAELLEIALSTSHSDLGCSRQDPPLP